jgi:thiamine kinase-like enzyme
VTSAAGAEAASVALSLARSLGLDAASARVLQSSANLSLHLEPADVVARVVAEVGHWRADHGFPDAARDVAVARAALVRGVPVARPLEPPLGGPHRAGGRVVSFWRYERLLTADHGYDEPVAVGRALRSLHVALRDASSELALPDLPVWDDTVTWLTLAPLLSEPDRRWLLALHGALSAEIAALDLPVQALHGDAHPGNAWVTPRGVIWSDFEESGSWPVEWDLACIMSGLPLGRDVEVRRTIVQTYGRDPDDPLIAPFLTARILMASAWMALTGDYRGRPMADRLAENVAWLRATRPPG